MGEELCAQVCAPWRAECLTRGVSECKNGAHWALAAGIRSSSPTRLTTSFLTTGARITAIREKSGVRATIAAAKRMAR
jgi:hypothetical protein